MLEERYPQMPVRLPTGQCGDLAPATPATPAAASHDGQGYAGLASLRDPGKGNALTVLPYLETLCPCLPEIALVPAQKSPSGDFQSSGHPHSEGDGTPFGRAMVTSTICLVVNWAACQSRD